ncbi:MAG TPA: cytochrome c [Ramlibacter sp.]|nr:cytochrome c [Ramlibacter sp.]
MYTRRTVAVLVAAMLIPACGTAPTMTPVTSSPKPAFGQPAPADLIAAWDISIPASGAGLPAGGATAREGAAIYLQKCASCHGERGAGKPADPLVGGGGTLASKTPLRTVGSYWPFATTLFDYTRRAMPLNNPMSLTDNEVYAVSAYVLYLNGLLGEDDRLDALSLAKIRMPNRDGFVSDWPARR